MKKILIFTASAIFILLIVSLFWSLTQFSQEIERSVIFLHTKTETPIASPTSTQTTVPTPTPTPTPTVLPTETPLPVGLGEVSEIGQTVEGRPIEVHRFGHGDHVLLIVAGIHGGYEWNTVALANELIAHLQANLNIIPEDKTLYILPALNIDGYEKDKGADGRANANNVDINRNFDANWQANWYGKNCWAQRFITAGSEPGSEPETQALIKFVLDNQVESLISYHSAGLGVFPGGWPNDVDAYNLAYSLGQVSGYTYPPIAGDCAYTGQLIDWASNQGITAVDVELSNHVDTDFERNLAILQVFLFWENQLQEASPTPE